MIRLLVLLLAAILAGCSPSDLDAVLHRYLSEELSVPDPNRLKAIICIAEEGCPSCDRTFAAMTREFQNTPGSLTIVHAIGSAVDMTGLTQESEYLRYDPSGRFFALGLLKGSGLILLREGRIDTVIPASNPGFDQRLRYMESRLRATLQEP